MNSVWRELLSSGRYQREAEKMLVEKRNNEDNLCTSARDGNAEEVGRLVSIGVDTGCRLTEYLSVRKGCTPLHYAAWEGHKHVGQILLA